MSKGSKTNFELASIFETSTMISKTKSIGIWNVNQKVERGLHGLTASAADRIGWAIARPIVEGG